MSEPLNFARRLFEKYQQSFPLRIITPVYTSKQRILARAALRPEEIESHPQIKKERRKYLRYVLGMIALSVPVLIGMKIANNPQHQPPENVSSQQTLGRLVSNALKIPINQSLSLNDPTYGPIILIHLDNSQFVAFSSICTHAGCLVQFNAKEIKCPCHGAVFNPYNNAQVVVGPAPTPLRKIPIQFDATTGNIYLL